MRERIKGFDDLSDEEVLALTPEQIERYIDLECAIQGVPLLPPDEPDRPEKVEIQRDVETFVVGGVRFRSQSDALEVAAFINARPRLTETYASGGSYNDKIAEEVEDDVRVQTERLFSPEQWKRERARAQEQQSLQNEYERQKRAYDEAVKKREEATRDIRNRIEDVRVRHYDRENLRREFLRYVDLADGDERIAANFLASAHWNAQELLPELYVVPDEAEPEKAVEVAS